jgi:hypothetical protein
MEDPPVTDFVRSDLLALLSEQARFNFRLLTAVIALNDGKKVSDEAIDQLVSGVGEIFGRQMRMLRSIRGRGDEL